MGDWKYGLQSFTGNIFRYSKSKNISQKLIQHRMNPVRWHTISEDEIDRVISNLDDDTHFNYITSIVKQRYTEEKLEEFWNRCGNKKIYIINCSYSLYEICSNKSFISRAIKLDEK